MTELAAKVLEIAESQLGVKEHPPGSNRGPEVDRYLNAVGLDAVRQSYPWCAAFVSYCIKQADVDLPQPKKFRGSARCLRLVELNQDLQLERPEPGCIFIHLKPDTNGHTGFVTAVTEDGIETIEGNSDAAGSRTGGQVVRQKRPFDYVECYLRIA